MIDYIKISANYLDAENLFRKLKGKGTHNFETDKVELPYFGRFYNLSVNAYRDGSIIIDGSIHKFWNMINYRGGHNYNLFTLVDLREAINFLSLNLGIEPAKTPLINIEYGLNLNTSFNPADMLNNNLIVYDGRSHHISDDFHGRGEYRQYKKGERLIKIYSKSKQYSLSENILRIEVKTMRGRNIPSPIMRLSDLDSIGNWKIIHNDLLIEIEKLMIVDVLDFRKIKVSKRDKDHLKNTVNPMCWELLRKGKVNDNQQKRKALTAKRNRFRRQSEKLVNRLGLNSIHNEILNLTRRFFPTLLSVNTKALPVAFSHAFLAIVGYRDGYTLNSSGELCTLCTNYQPITTNKASKMNLEKEEQKRTQVERQKNPLKKRVKKSRYDLVYSTRLEQRLTA